MSYNEVNLVTTAKVMMLIVHKRLYFGLPYQQLPEYPSAYIQRCNMG